MIKEIIKLEPKDFSMLKLVEELAELQEVCIKTLTKPTGALEGKRLEHLIEEFGDVHARMAVVLSHLDLNSQVVDRRQVKLIETLAACKKRYGRTIS